MLMNSLRNLRYNKIERKQYIPTREDVKSAKKIAERLKGKNDVETLNNVLEWQHKNIIYWTERGYLDISLHFIYIPYIFIFIFLCLFLYLLLNLLISSPFISQMVSIGLTFLFIFWLIFRAKTSVKLIYLILWSYPVYKFLEVLILKSSVPQEISTLLILTLINGIFFGFFLFALLYLYLIYRPFARQEKSFKSKAKKIWELICLTFKISLPIQKLLKYKMAICRDYAKLTAAILLNLYPKNKIYFFGFPGHIATGIEINDKVYILDQKLPVLDEKSWLIRWGKKEATKLELVKNETKYSVKFIGKITLEEVAKVAKIDKELEKLVEKIIEAIKRKEKIVTFRLKEGAKVYDIDDVIIKESLLRTIKNFLQKELVSKFSQVKDISISRENADLIVNVKLKGDQK